MNALGVRKMEDLAGMALWNTLCNNGDGLDLGIGEDFECTRIDRARRGEVDHNINVGMFLHSLAHGRIHGKEGLLGTPVELLNMVATKRIDHSGNRRGLASTRVIEVEHALNGTRLEAVHERASRSVEGAIRGTALIRASLEPHNLIVGL